MKSIFIIFFILFSITYAKEESSLLNKIKEENGIKLTKEEFYVNYIKNELKKTLQYYILNKKISKLDSILPKYISTVNNIKNINDLFSKNVMDFKFRVKNQKNSYDEFLLSDLIFKLSYLNEDIEYFQFYLDNVNKIKLSFKYDVVKNERKKFDILFLKLNKDKEFKREFINDNNLIDFNYFISFDKILKYGKAYNLFSLIKQDGLKLPLDEYIFLLKNETFIKRKNESLYFLVKSELEKEIKLNKTIEKDIVIFSEAKIGRIDDYNLNYYYLLEFKLKTNFLNYLLTATNKPFYFNNYKYLFNKTVSDKDILQRYNNLYKMNENLIKIENLSEKIITFNNGHYYKTFLKKKFNKRFFKLK